MIARHDGRVVLVSGAIPGERVQARIDRVAKGVAHCRAVAIDEPSPDRRARPAIRCAAAASTRTSPIRASSRSRARSSPMRSRASAASSCRAPVVVAASPEDGYRMRARLHVRGARVGFFREGHARSLRRAADAAAAAGDARGARAVDGGRRSIGAHAVREIELSENVDAQRARRPPRDVRAGRSAPRRQARCRSTA